MRPSTVTFDRIFALLAAIVVASCSTAKTRVPGEVVVVVTSDMAVPQDIDTLTWSITVVGDERPFKANSVDLKEKPLPQTLAIASDRGVTGPVLIQLDGSRAGTSRVHREARGTLPADGEVMRLTLPLNWLCTRDANPSLSCGAGQTCVAGACMPSEMDPVPYVPPKTGCFDVGACFIQPVGGVLTVAPDPKTGRCVPQNEPISGNEDLNVALAVNTSKIGNYGSCGVLGLCLIPLSRGGPEGWTALTEDDGTTRIALPQSVCNDSGTTLNGIVVSLASSTCPSKPQETAVCSRVDTCIRADTCPSDWGPDWAGYSCSGLAPIPQAGVQACWPPPPPPDAGARSGSPSGLACCALGTGGQGGSLLIDDMSGGSQVRIAPPRRDEIAGFWFTATDDLTAPLRPPPLSLFTYTALPSGMTPDGGPANAACLKSDNGFTGNFVLEGFNFVLPAGRLSEAGDPFDVSAYTGISFWAWSRYAGQSIKVAFPDLDTGETDTQSTCKQRNLQMDAGQCGNDWAIQSLVLKSDWTQYDVRWDQLRQAAGWGLQFAQFDPKHVFATVFLLAGATPDPYPPFEFCVSQIYFTQ